MHTSAMKRINISLAPLVLTLCLLASCNYGAKPIDPQEPAASSSSTNVAALCQQAHDPNAQVRLEAIQNLKNLSILSPAVLAALRRAIKDQNWCVSEEAGKALLNL